jgi:hypothetical protein
MTDLTNVTDVVVPEFPIETDYGNWAIEHPECDSIIEQIGTGPIILVYAYATSHEGNKTLMRIKEQKFADKEILMGVTLDGIRRLI